MGSVPIPPLFPWIVDNLEWIIPTIVVAWGGLIYFVKVTIYTPLKMLRHLIRIVPPEALEQKLWLATQADVGRRIKPLSDKVDEAKQILPTLQTKEGCKESRENCGIVDVVGQLGDDIKKILVSTENNRVKNAKALTMLINYLPLTEGQRVKIAEEIL